MVDKAAQNLLDTLMATRRDSLRQWWSRFEQVKQLSELMGHSLSSLVDDFIHAAPTDPRHGQQLSFEEYLLHRAVSEIPDLLRLCPRPFFDLMDVAELMEGRNETRSRASWMKMAPLLFPLAGTEGVAAMVYDALVESISKVETLADGTEAPHAQETLQGELTFKRFEEYIDALCKAEFETNYAEHWSVIKEQCGLVATEKCVLHTPYAADCSQFPPAVGSLYLSAEHLVFQDPVLHNRRVISLSTVLDVKRVPVELRHARLLLAQIPGLGLFARGGVLGGLARLAGFQQKTAEAPASGNGSPNIKARAVPRLSRDTGSDDGASSEGGGGEKEKERGGGKGGGGVQAGDDGGLGLSAVLVRWQGGSSAKFMFVEVSGLLLSQWLKHLQELVLAHKLSLSRASRSINMFESHPWLPAFVAENLQRAQVPELLVCTSNSNADNPDHEGGTLVRELYASYGAAHRYKRLEDTERNLDIFNLKTFDQNLAMLEDLSADLLLAIKDLDALTTWERPLHSAAALAASLAVFWCDALYLVVPGALLGVAGRLAFQGVRKWVSAWRHPLLKSQNSSASLQLLMEEGGSEGGAESSPSSPEREAAARKGNGGEAAGAGREGNNGEARGGEGGAGHGGMRRRSAGPEEEVVVAGGSRGITERNLRHVGFRAGGDRSSGGRVSPAERSGDGPMDSEESVDGGSGDDEREMSPASPDAGEDGDGAAEAVEEKGWLRRMGETVVSVRKFRSNMRKLLQDNLIQVEKHLQVGLQVGREKTQKLSQLQCAAPGSDAADPPDRGMWRIAQNTVQSVNRILAKLAVLHSWQHPRQSCNYVLVVASTGTFLALVPPRWLFLAAVVGKFSPGDTMMRKIQGTAIFLAKRYLDPPEDNLRPEESPVPAIRPS